MILRPGSNTLIVHRRLFEDDHIRFFVGTVDFYENGMAKITGYSWSRDPYTGHLVKKNDRRTKIISLISGTVFAYELDDTLVPANLVMKQEDDGRLILTGDGFSMDLTEKPKKQ